MPGPCDAGCKGRSVDSNQIEVVHGSMIDETAPRCQMPGFLKKPGILSPHLDVIPDYS